MHADLNDFLGELGKRKLLTHIAEPVSPDLEIAAVTDRVCKQPGGGAALLFDKPTGFDIPVATNVFGSLERMCLALGVKSLDDLAQEINALLAPQAPAGVLDALKMLPLVNRLRDLMPKTVKDGPCQEVVRRDGTLDELPILTCWPEDGGRFITLPLVFTRDPESGTRNIGTYRMQVFDGRTTGMHWQRHKGGAQHHRVAERLSKRLEVAVALSPEPVLTYCATAPMPEGLDELLLGGFLARRRIEMVKCVTVDLEVPANAHIVLEGYVEPGERRREGPFGDHTGFYSQPDDYPVFHLTCLTHRKRPTYLTTIVGIPPMEDYYLGMASERIFLPLIQKTHPEIVDMHFPAQGIFHNLVIISIDKRYPGHARKIMNAVWGLGQLMFSKTVVIVDRDVNVHDVSEVAWIVGTHMDPLRDVQMTRGPVDDLDDAAEMPAYGGKMGIDATRKWASEGYTRSWPARIRTTEQAARRAAQILEKSGKRQVLAVDRGQVRAFRLAAQHLTDRLAAGALVEAAAACGFQNTPPGTAALALHARVERVKVEDLERALLVDKTLLQAWSLRGAPHVIPTRDQAVFLRGLVPTSEDSIRAFLPGVVPALDTVGITATRVAAHASAALDAVLGERRMTKDELGVALAEWIGSRLTPGQLRQWEAGSWYLPGQTLGESIIRFVLPVLALQGVCCHAERRGGKAYLARTPAWLGQAVLESHAAPDGDGLVRRYLRCFGPSTSDHFAAWAGVGESQASQLWRLVAPNCLEVEVEGRSTWLHRDDGAKLLSPPEPQGVRFLPPHDPYLALRDRATIVADPTWQREVWRAQGNPGVVIGDGEVVAVWRTRASRTRLDVAIEWVVSETPRLKGRVNAEAEPLAAFRGFKSVKVTYQ